jgi:hypothetical protein
MSTDSPGIRSRAWLAAYWCLAAIAISSCVGCEPDTSYHVTGVSSGSTQGDQSETDTTTSFARDRGVGLVTAFNTGGEPGSLEFDSPNGREVRSGDSGVGWSYSFDPKYQTWTDGGTLKPPPGWPVIWSDPAIADYGNSYQTMFISALAVPDEKMPSSGAISGYMSPYLGGACIYRSDDAGIHFHFQQCLTRNHDFYDGGTVVSGMNGDPRVWAAYVDDTANRIDVWEAPDANGPFRLLPDPFADLNADTLEQHPLLRYDLQTHALLVGAELGHRASDGTVVANVYLNRRSGGWQKPVLASNQTALNPTIDVSTGKYGGTTAGRVLRTGHGFGFDVGAESEVGGDGIRVAYVALSNDKTYVTGSYCDRRLTECHPSPNWGTTPGNFELRGSQFSPEVRAWNGFIGIAPAWKLTYVAAPGDGTVSIHQGNLARIAPNNFLYLPFDLVTGLTPCASLKTDYWGDYDRSTLVDFPNQTARFALAHSDSGSGCVKQYPFSSSHVHVSVALFQ